MAAEQIVPKLKTVTLSFNLPQAPAPGQQVRLGLKARVKYPQCANNPALVIAVNGTNIVGGNLLNKPLEYLDRNGRDVFWALPGDSMWYLYSWPDFSLQNAWACPSPYAIAQGVDPFEFVLDITPHLKPGTNSVSFTHPEIVSDLDHFVALRDVRVEIGQPIASQAGTVPRPAPRGALPTYFPKGAPPVAMKVQLASGGTIRLQVGKRSFDLATRTSEPEGKWSPTTTGTWRTLSRGQSASVNWAGNGYKIRRTVTLKDDHLDVADTFANNGDQLVGVMCEHRLKFSDKPLEVRLAGMPPYADYINDGGGTNPTALARWPELAVGLVAVDDIFRSHAQEFARPDAIGLADHELGLGPGQSHTLEWSVYPVPQGDYWDFINAIRRDWGANFAIPGPAVFVDWSTSAAHDDEYYRQWFAQRPVKSVNAYDAMFDGGHAAMGTAIPLATKFCAQTAQWIQQMHTVAPGVQALFYMNATLCTEPDAAGKYADSKLLRFDGTPVTIAAGSPQGVTMAPTFICTPENSYGRAMMQTVHYLIEDLHADGLYHDVFNLGENYGARAYRTTWDGCTVSIDTATHRVTGKAASVVLLQQSWEVALVDYLRTRGKMFMANGPVETRTLLNLRFPTFVELGFSFSELTKTHLGSPWGYGNHPVPDPKRGLDAGLAYQQRRLLDYGGILAVPSWNQTPAKLSFIPLLYPITPVELRAGMVFARERIVTNRSGIYGWPDGATAVYVFDGSGVHVPSAPVRLVNKSGLHHYEVRMPSDHFAILVRK